MDDLTKWTDKQLFTDAGEQPGSQMAYYRQVETQRRLYDLQREGTRATIEAANATIGSANAQKEAAEAARDTAIWTRRAGIAVAGSVIVMTISTVIQAIALFDWAGNP